MAFPPSAPQPAWRFPSETTARNGTSTAILRGEIDLSPIAAAREFLTLGAVGAGDFAVVTALTPSGRTAMAAKKKAAKKAKKSTRKTAKKSTRKTAKKSARKSARRPNAAFMKAMQPSDQLSEVIGGSPMPRTEVTKKLWAYIKRKGLQDKKNRRMINADENLRPIFKRDQVSMFEMTKLVNRHLS
jgi:hypothetical protein